MHCGYLILLDFALSSLKCTMTMCSEQDFVDIKAFIAPMSREPPPEETVPTEEEFKEISERLTQERRRKQELRQKRKCEDSR